jgi:uncharacterized protein (AIM24 family)
MRTEITYSPAYAVATIHLDPGESVSAEAGAMLAMTLEGRTLHAQMHGDR